MGDRMNFTDYYEQITTASTNDIINIGLYVLIAATAAYFLFFKKKKPLPKSKDMKGIKQNQEALNTYDTDSDEKQIAHLEGKKAMMLAQATLLKRKYYEILKMNSDLKVKYEKVSKQIEILKVEK